MFCCCFCRLNCVVNEIFFNFFLFQFINFDCDCNEFSNIEIFSFFIVIVKFCFNRDLRIFSFNSIKKFVDVELNTNIMNEILCNSNDFIEIDEKVNFYFVVQLLKKVEFEYFCELVRKFLIAFLKFWNLSSLRSQFNEYVINKKKFVFNIDDDFFTFFKK